ncbi:MAG: hypothetical protein Fur0043_12610 [Anaerolineales bacterium]
MEKKTPNRIKNVPMRGMNSLWSTGFSLMAEDLMQATMTNLRLTWQGLDRSILLAYPPRQIGN